MFLAVGMLAYRFRSRQIKDYGGLATRMPLLASFFMLFAMSNVGLPGTSGFVGEFMIILSAMQGSFWITTIAASTLILSAAYTLYMYKRVFFGEITNPLIAKSNDIHGFEKLGVYFINGGDYFYRYLSGSIIDDYACFDRLNFTLEFAN